MRIVALATLALAIGFGPATDAWAEGIDGTTPLVCDLTEAAQCDGTASCAGVTTAQIDLPPVLLVDFETKRLSSEDGERASPITTVDAQEASLLLQGQQNGRGWAMVIDRATGHLSATAVDADGAFVLAGACTAR